MKIHLAEEHMRSMSSGAIVEYLKNKGVEFTNPMEPLAPGLYRRLNGRDMINVSPDGNITYVDCWEYQRPVDIMWVVYSIENREAWIHVLNEDYKPVINGAVVYFNSEGERVK